MKAQDIKNYPLFIFTAEDYCMQTADYNILKFVYDSDDEHIQSNFEIGQTITFRMADGSRRKFKIENISVKGVVENISDNQLGVIMDGCMETSGEKKDESMFIHITMKNVK